MSDLSVNLNTNQSNGNKEDDILSLKNVKQGDNSIKTLTHDDMILIRDIWAKADVNPFLNYLYPFSRGDDKAEWEKRIVNTSLKCIAVPSNVVLDIVKSIKKGNLLSFINVFMGVWDNLTLVNILGKLICEIKDFVMFKSYLLIYAAKVDNWSSCDCLKFKCKATKDEYVALSNQMLASSKPFVRRIGLGILFSNIPVFADEIFVELDLLQYEQDYYVNMMGAWLLAECMVKIRDKALSYFETNSTNSFVINKAISKCRDSYRVSAQDKQFLLRYKK